VGGSSAKVGGMASGARVVTVNSSGASRTKPKVRPSLSVLQPPSAIAQTASRPIIPQYLFDVSITPLS
jgi:hypothetical protein